VKGTNTNYEVPHHVIFSGAFITLHLMSKYISQYYDLRLPQLMLFLQSEKTCLDLHLT